MKKAIWVSWVTYCSTSLDVAISPHDCEALAIVKLLEKAGFESWLLEPYKLKKKQSSFPRRVTIEEAEEMDWDLVLTWPICDSARQSYEGPWAKPSNDRIVDFVESNKDVAMAIFNDPRKKFHKPLHGQIKGDSKLWDLLSTLPVLVPATGLMDDPGREVVCEYWKVLDFDVVPFNKEPDLGSVYAGLPKQSRDRKKLIRKWFEDSTDGYLAGGLTLPDIPSITDGQACLLSETIEFSRRSRTTFICAEPEHTWITPRVAQALMCGTIASFSPTLNMLHLFPEWSKEQTCERLVDFNDSLRTQDVYDRQVNFYKSLAKSVKPLAV